ncbi:MAG TPA: ATP-binding protein [Pyrinomonadaceae bacterium]
MSDQPSEMQKPTDGIPGSQPELFPTFGDNFLANHAGRIMSEPKIAIVELVANCWDAGADTVEIEWPLKRETVLSIRDNGTGMTRLEFIER